MLTSSLHTCNAISVECVGHFQISPTTNIVGIFVNNSLISTWLFPGKSSQKWFAGSRDSYFNVFNVFCQVVQKRMQLSALQTVENTIILCNLCQFHKIFKKAFQTCSVRCTRLITLSFSERRKTRSPERLSYFINITQLWSLNPSKPYSFHLNLGQSQGWFSRFGFWLF